MYVDNPTVSTNGNSLNSFLGIQITNSILMGSQSRSLQQESSERTHSLRKVLSKNSLEFQKGQTEEEIMFMRECFYRGLKQQIELTSTSCNNLIQETEFHKFCENWNQHFKINISAVLNELKSLSYDPNNIIKPKLMIARSKVLTTEYGKGSKADIRGIYYDFCQDFIEDYPVNQDFDASWLNAWEKDCISPISDTINLHYIMQGLPTILIFPCYRGNNISIEIATWAFNPGKTNMCFDKLISIDKSYIKEDPERLHLAILAAAIFLNDAFRMTFFQKEADLLSKYQKIFSKHELLWNIVQELYKNLKSNIDSSIIKALSNN